MAAADWFTLALSMISAALAIAAVLVSFLAYRHSVRIHIESGPVCRIINRPLLTMKELDGSEKAQISFSLINSGRLDTGVVEAWVDFGPLLKVRQIPFLWMDLGGGRLDANSKEDVFFSWYVAEDLTADEQSQIPGQTMVQFVKVTVIVTLGNDQRISSEPMFVPPPKSLSANRA